MLPDFLVVGAARSGTTSLYHYLGQHPQVYLSPVKEPEYFSFMGTTPGFIGPGSRSMNAGIITDPHDYEALFDDARDELARGECSTSYLFIPAAARNIHRAVPRCRIIIVLRNPADRAWSNYRDHVMALSEDLSFEDALAAEPRRQASNWRWGYQYAGQGYYYRQVKRYLDLFGADQVKVCLFEDLINRPGELVQELYRFLDVDDRFRPDVTVAYNPGGLPGSERLQRFYTGGHWLKRLLKPLVPARLWQPLRHWLVRKNLRQEPLAPSVRRRLLAQFEADIQKLETLTGLDLSGWRT